MVEGIYTHNMHMTKTPSWRYKRLITTYNQTHWMSKGKKEKPQFLGNISGVHSKVVFQSRNGDIFLKFSINQLLAWTNQCLTILHCNICYKRLIQELTWNGKALVHWCSMRIQMWIICWWNRRTVNIELYSNGPFTDFFWCILISIWG